MHTYLLKELQKEEGPATRQADKRNKRVTFKNCAPFTDCISEINST